MEEIYSNIISENCQSPNITVGRLEENKSSHLVVCGVSGSSQELRMDDKSGQSKQKRNQITAIHWWPVSCKRSTMQCMMFSSDTEQQQTFKYLCRV